MTMDELRAELERTRPTWGAEVRGANLDEFLATGEQASLAADARRHLKVLTELDRRVRAN